MNHVIKVAVVSLKKGRSVGVDDIPAELVQAGGETMIDVLTEICNRIWRMDYPMDSIFMKRQLVALPELQNYMHHQSFDQSHAQVILNRLKELKKIAEEHAGFRA